MAKIPFSSVSRYSLTGEPCGPERGVFRTSSRFGSAPQATTATPAGMRLPLFVWIFRRTVLPSKPFKLSPRSKLTQASRRFAGQQSTAHDNNRLLQVRHLAQRERIANRSQIDNISQAHARDWRP